MIPKWMQSLLAPIAALFVFLGVYKINNNHQRNKGRQQERDHNTKEEFEAYKRKIERENQVTAHNRRISNDELYNKLRAYADEDGE